MSVFHGKNARKRWQKAERRRVAKVKREQHAFLNSVRYGDGIRSSRVDGLSNYALPEKFEYAAEMSHAMTASEALFNSLATPHRIGFKLYPQIVVLGYIVDFYSFKYKIAVEIDGSFHDTVKQKIWDSNRDEAMREHGILVIRFRATTDENTVLGQLFRLREAWLRRSGKVSPT